MTAGDSLEEMFHRQQAGDESALDALVAQHGTLLGTHRASTMPLLAQVRA